MFFNVKMPGLWVKNTCEDEQFDFWQQRLIPIALVDIGL